MLRTPYLPGESDMDQLKTIFRALGTPTEEEWPVSLLAYLLYFFHILSRGGSVSNNQQKHGTSAIFCISLSFFFFLDRFRFIARSF
jgi:hypothetical protein